MNNWKRTTSHFGEFRGQRISLQQYQTVLQTDLKLLTKNGAKMGGFVDDCEKFISKMNSVNRIELDPERTKKYAATITDPTWSGITLEQDFIQELVAAAPFLSESQLVHKITGHYGEVRIPGFAADVCFQDDNCEFDPQTNMTGQIKSVTPRIIKVEAEACWKDLIGTFADMQLDNLDILGYELPTSFADIWISIILQKVQRALERAFFLGTTGDPASIGLSGSFTACELEGKVNGIISKLESEGGYIQVEIPPVLTNTNTLDAFDTVYNAMFDLNENLAGRAESELAFLVNTKTLALFKQNVRSHNVSINENSNPVRNVYNETIDIEHSLWMPRNQIWLTHKRLSNGRPAPFAYLTHKDGESSNFMVDRVTNLGSKIGFSLSFVFGTEIMQLSGSPVNEQNVIIGKA